MNNTRVAGSAYDEFEARQTKHVARVAALERRIHEICAAALNPASEPRTSGAGPTNPRSVRLHTTHPSSPSSPSPSSRHEAPRYRF